MQPKKERKLTLKQRKFISGKIAGKSGAQAARDAGYSKRSSRLIAAENQTKPNILKEIDAKTAEIMQKLDLSAENLLKDIKNTGLLALAAGDYGSAMRALDMIAKHIDLYHAHQQAGAIDLKPLRDWLAESE